MVMNNYFVIAHQDYHLGSIFYGNYIFWTQIFDENSTVKEKYRKKN
jgi:hypothetical protein